MTPVVDRLLSGIETAGSGTHSPFIVAIDGGAGAGKSTLAAHVARRLGIGAVTLDDFFTTRVAEPELARFPVETRWQHWFEWDRVRGQALEPPRRGDTARWQVFDYLGPRDEVGRYRLKAETTELAATDIVIFEGATSASPIVAELVDFAVLVSLDEGLRQRRKAGRGDGDYADLDTRHALHDVTQQHYLTRVCPPSRFDLVLDNEFAHPLP